MSQVEQLFAEIYANPEDDQVRRVLADALLAAGDPRGELILFQLEPDKDDHRRAMRLIQAHGLSWLGPLRGGVIPLAYERGFLASAALIRRPPVAVDFDHPMWATVHTLELGDLDGDDLASVRITPAMRSLARVTGLTSAGRTILLSQHRAAMLARLQLVLAPDPIVEPPPDEYFDAVDE